MISEADVVSALKHGCERAILLGNQMLTQGLFLLNPTSAHRALFQRVGSFIDVSQKQTKTKPKFTFVDLSDSQQEQKKESFTNEAEARAVWDLLAAFDLDLQETAVMTPYRT